MSVEITGVDEVVVKLKKVSDSIAKDADKALRRYGFNLYALLRTRTPIDTGRMVGDWKTSQEKNFGSVATFKIYNNVPYAGVMETGSKAGHKPWPSPGPLTTMVGGNIYSKQAPGGMVTPILTKVSAEAAKEIYMEIEHAAA